MSNVSSSFSCLPLSLSLSSSLCISLPSLALSLSLSNYLCISLPSLSAVVSVIFQLSLHLSPFPVCRCLCHFPALSASLSLPCLCHSPALSVSLFLPCLLLSLSSSLSLSLPGLLPLSVTLQLSLHLSSFPVCRCLCHSPALSDSLSLAFPVFVSVTLQLSLHLSPLPSLSLSLSLSSSLCISLTCMRGVAWPWLPANSKEFQLLELFPYFHTTSASCIQHVYAACLRDGASNAEWKLSAYFLGHSRQGENDNTHCKVQRRHRRHRRPTWTGEKCYTL